MGWTGGICPVFNCAVTRHVVAFAFYRFSQLKAMGGKRIDSHELHMTPAEVKRGPFLEDK